MKDNSILEARIHPLKQAIGVLSILIVILGVAKLIFSPTSSNYWEIVSAGVLFYAMMNAVLSIAFENQNYYWLYSIIGFFTLLLLGGGLAYILSGTNIDEAGSFRWIFLVFTMGYIILLGIVRTMKKIITIAQREDTRFKNEQ